MNTSDKGKLAESLVIAQLIKHGFNVSIPFSDYRYDLIAEDNGIFKRVQIKYVGKETKRSTVNVVLHSVDRSGRSKYKNNEVDFVVAYYEPRDIYYVIPLKDVEGKTAINIRLNEPANGQKIGIIDSAKYENRWDLLRG